MVVHVTVPASDRDCHECLGTCDYVLVLFFVRGREAAVMEEMGDRLSDYTVRVGVSGLGNDDLLSLHRRRMLRDVGVGVRHCF